MIDINKIYNADCLELMKQIPDNSIDCIFSDVPYKVSQGGCSTSSKYGSKNKWSNNPDKLNLYKKGMIFDENDITPDEYLPDMFRVLKDMSHIYIMCNSSNLLNIGTSMEKNGFKINNILVMRKNNCVTNQWYMKDIEFTIFARKGMAKPLNDMGLKSCIDVVMPNSSNKIHDTEKPLPYVKALIKNSTKEGDVVLDPFSGSAVVAVACIQSNRNYICIEKDKKFYDLSVNRVNGMIQMGLI